MTLIDRWVWIGVGYLIGAIIFLHVVIILAQKFLGPLGKNAAVLSEEALRARDISLFGQSGKGELDDAVLDVDGQVMPALLSSNGIGIPEAMHHSSTRVTLPCNTDYLSIISLQRFRILTARQITAGNFGYKFHQASLLCTIRVDTQFLIDLLLCRTKAGGVWL